MNNLSEQERLRLYEQNEGLAIWYANAKINCDINDLDDFIQIARVGLWEACQTWIESKHLSFTTYATMKMRNSTLNYARTLKKHITELPVETTKTRTISVDALLDAIDTQKNFTVWFEALCDMDKQIVTCKLQGWNNTEIAKLIDRTPANVGQRLKKMKRKYNKG